MGMILGMLSLPVLNCSSENYQNQELVKLEQLNGVVVHPPSVPIGRGKDIQTETLLEGVKKINLLGAI